jgi:hypothetical protein
MLKKVDQEEGAEQVAVAEDEVLVELDAALAVQVDVEQLAGPQRLGDADGDVEAGLSTGDRRSRSLSRTDPGST